MNNQSSSQSNQNQDRKATKSSRPLVSLFMFAGLIAIVVTGVLSYLLRYSNLLSAVHTIFGLLFISYSMFHLKNNWRSLISYLKNAVNKKTWYIALSIMPLTVIGIFFELPPFKTIIDIGYGFKELEAIDDNTFQVLYTNSDKAGTDIHVDIRVGDHYAGPGPKILWFRKTNTPQIALWIEDIEGNYIDTLYVTKRSAKNSYLTTNIFSDEIVKRPEALPHWSFSRGISDKDGLMMPTQNAPLADAITGSTPLSHFDLKSTIGDSFKQLVVKLEVNRSYDFNDFYHPEAFPDDAIYSGSGNSAQPSIIYSATIDHESNQTFYLMDLLGRGHHSGKDGLIHSDMKGITTALDIIGRALVTVQKP